MILGTGVAQAATLNVPFFRDAPTFTPATRAFVGLKNTSLSDQTITITYTAVNVDGDVVDQQETFFLGANAALSWEPVEDNPGLEGAGSVVPNMEIVINTDGDFSCCGAVRIDGSDTLAGRYQEIDDTAGAVFAHALVG